ncbi:MAG: dihydrofolate reductase family protein [Verrucomicrobiota bacterium JB022]|nr:dihydrofolate reductase family protein [Verrucomicrobiota bacterium JB022]
MIQRPNIILIAVQSVDGFITCGESKGTDFASEADQEWFAFALQQLQAVAMGSGTYEAERELIRRGLNPERPKYILTRQPEKYAHEAVEGALIFTDASPEELAREWGARGWQRVGLVGGSVMHGKFLEQGLVDELWLTLEPFLFGRGLPLAPIDRTIDLTLDHLERLTDQTLLLRYRVNRAQS